MRQQVNAFHTHRMSHIQTAFHRYVFADDCATLIVLWMHVHISCNYAADHLCDTISGGDTIVEM